MKNDTEQINAKVPKALKTWAKHRADENFQSLSGFIARLLNEEKNRYEAQQKQRRNID